MVHYLVPAFIKDALTSSLCMYFPSPRVSAQDCIFLQHFQKLKFMASGYSLQMVSNCFFCVEIVGLIIP